MPLYDIVLADLTEAATLASSDSPLSSFPGFSCRPIDHVKLAQLFAELGIASFDEALDALEPIATGSDDGPFVSLLSPALLSAISHLDAKGVCGIAENWGSSEEFALDGIGAQQAQDFLRSIQALGQHANGEKWSLFLWATA